MNSPHMHILLADDDKDDCFLFQEALAELSLNTSFTAVNDGEQLINYLTHITGQLPDVLFLDLNMPRKNGFQCLEEIKHSHKLIGLPVIIFSTSYDEKMANLLYKNGAHCYICKPADFSQLKKVIQHVLMLMAQKNASRPSQEEFLLSNLKSVLF